MSKIAVSYKMDEQLLERMRAYIERHKLRPSQIAIIEAALREYLDREEGPVQRGAR